MSKPSAAPRRGLRAITAFSAIAALLHTGAVARSAPKSIYNGNPYTPVSSSGDAVAPEDGVSQQTGTFSYAVPIEVPPGRLGLEPQLGLTYSSDGAIYGGIAAGWSMDVPSIQLDTRDGILVEERHWISGLAGGERLQPTDEPHGSNVAGVYRARYDLSGARYERQAAGQPFEWIVRSLDGTVSRYGRRSGSAPTEVLATLEEVEDVHGNLIEYQWGWWDVALAPRLTAKAYALLSIEYTSNPSAGLDSFARVDFSYSAERPCSGGALPIGSQLSVRTGVPIIDGYLRLDAISTSTVDRQTPDGIVRSYELVYDDEEARCDLEAAPRRQLIAVKSTGWSPDGTSLDLPPVTFDYHPRVNSYYRDVWQVRTEREDGQLRSQTNLFVDHMLVDMDGDGLPDRLVSGDKGCDFYWQRNTGAGFEEARRWVHRPALPDGDVPDGWVLDDGFEDTTNYLTQRCALNAQYTLVTTPKYGLPDETCRHDGENHRAGTVVNWRFMDVDHDGLVDMVAGVDLNRIAVNGDAPGFDHQGLLETDLDQVTNTSFVGEIDELIAALEAEHDGDVPFECEAVLPREVGSWFQWIVYRNVGGGQFASQPELWGMPVPVVAAASSARSKIGGNQASGIEPDIDGVTSVWADPFSFVDIDGDGFEDIVSSFKTQAELDGQVPPSTQWQVLRGRPDGRFEGSVAGVPYLVDAPPREHANGTAISDHVPAPYMLTIYSASPNGLYDVNGDLLPDFAWVRSDDHDFENYSTWNVSAHSWLGNGQGTTMCDGDGCALQLSATQQVAQGGIANLSLWTNPSLMALPFYSYSFTASQLVDVDGDGRLDLVAHGSVRINAGDRFLSPRPLATEVMVAGWQRAHIPALFLPYSYGVTLLTDIDGDGRLDPMVHQDRGLDMDGNGIIDSLGLDVVDEHGTWSVYLATREPQGLLRRIDNGVGGRTHVTYATVRDDWVVEDWALPVQSWVVASVTTSGGDATPAQVTTYDYADPAWLPDEDGRYGFRGFRRVGVNTPAGARISTLYDYGAFYRGLPVETVTTDATITGEPPRSIGIQSWQAHSFLGVPLWTVMRQDQRTCALGQDISTCRAYGELLRIETSWEAVTHGGLARAFLPKIERKAAGEDVEAVDATSTTTGYQVHVADGASRVKVHTVHRRVRTPAGEETIGYLEKLHDPELRWLLEEAVQVDEQRSATTRFTYDPATGQLRTIERPESVANGAGQVSTTVYDPYGARVRQVINELGHVTTTIQDLGTGLPTVVKGPQYKCPGYFLPCEDPWKVWRTTELRYDGAGRLRSRKESFDSGSTSYALREVERHTYSEWNGTFPALNKVISERRIDASEPANWTRTQAITDGLGRPVRETVHTFDSAVPDAVVVYHRDARGLVTSVETPDPSLTDGTRVTQHVEHDGLGRPIRSWHSSGLGGIRHVMYDGLWTTSFLQANDTGPAPEVRHKQDVFGRLARVEEKTSSGAPAVTEYDYDANGNLELVIDADGLMTALGHDLVGNRRWVERGGRRWELAYDLEQRAISTTVPHPPGMEDAYTSWATYDALGRIETRSPAAGALTEVEQAELALGTVEYFYDEYHENLGALNRVVSPAWAQEYRYGATGLVTLASQRLTAPGAPSELLEQGAVYDALGNPTQIVHPDGTTALYAYDRRGLPRQVRTPQVNVAEQLRNPAGLVVQRITKYGTASPASRTTWSYDALGRIHEQRVDLRPIGAPWMTFARQTHGYYDSNDIRHLKEKINSSERVFDFGYDQQSQILEARDDLGYFAAYEYTPAGRLLAADVDAPPGADVTSRDVFYDYDVQDLERVRAVVDEFTGADRVTLAYDEAGNITKREATDVAQLRYDGDGKLRIAIRDGEREVYHYDASGRRILAVRSVGGVVTETRRWFGDVQITDEAGENTTNLTINLGTPVARVHNGQVEYLHHNAAGNLLLAVNAIGVPVAGFSYGAFGEILQAQQQADRFPRRYQDNERDELSGWYDYDHRLYDPETHLWNRADPLFQMVPDAAGLEPRRMSLYAFSLNNPLRYVDPDGRNPIAQFFSAMGRAIYRGAMEGAKVLGRGFSAVASGFKQIVAVPAQVLGEMGRGTGNLVAANAAPCNGSCGGEDRVSQEDAVWYIAAAAAIMVAPPVRHLRANMQRAAVAETSGAAAGTSLGATSVRVGAGAARVTATAGSDTVAARAIASEVGIAGTADDIARIGGRVMDASQLSVNVAAKNRVFLGHFGGEGVIAGGKRIAVPNPGLQTLETLAREYGGRTLAGMPGNIDALAPAIRSADEIIFNIGAGGIRPNTLTAQELGLIVREGILDNVKFVTGLTY